LWPGSRAARKDRSSQTGGQRTRATAGLAFGRETRRVFSAAFASPHQTPAVGWVRCAEANEEKGVAPREKAAFSQDDGGFRPSWRFWRDFPVFCSQGALQWGSPCVAPVSPRSTGIRHAHPRRSAPVRLG